MRHADGFRRRLALDDTDGLRAILQGAGRVVAVSVRPEALAKVCEAAAAVGLSVACAGVDLPCPLRIDYQTPRTLGADRWVGCVAAHHDSGAAVVVDCGTATTCNIVDGDGVFRGGQIAPGLRAFVVGMQQLTPGLPAARLDATPLSLPRSTQDAIDAGVLLGYCGLVERLVAAALAAIGVGAVVHLTGGNAEVVQRLSRLRARVVPDLVHRGLQRLAGESSCAP